MIDLFSVASSLGAAASIIIIANNVLFKKEFKALSKTYGRRIALIISLLYSNHASEYARVEEVVLQGDDQEALLFRSSVATECNMTAVAVSVLIF